MEPDFSRDPLRNRGLERFVGEDVFLRRQVRPVLGAEGARLPQADAVFDLCDAGIPDRQRIDGRLKRVVEDFPRVGFGKPVIAGTGISTAVIASRFNARESVPDLAKEYGLDERQVEEAIRWETRAVAA